MRSILRRTAVVAVATIALAACGGGASKKADGDMELGSEDATVTVVEYASVTCSHCAAWNEEVWPQFKAKYVDTGKVRYVFREFLTPPQDVAAAGFLLARCAGEERYFEVVDAIMRSQQEMFSTGDVRGTLLGIARQAGMNEQQFNTCVTDEDALKALNSRVERAYKQDGVQATPTFFVNGKKVGEGAMSLAQLDAALEPELAKK
jgi:protein-disulfide isomerase